MKVGQIKTFTTIEIELREVEADFQYAFFEVRVRDNGFYYSSIAIIGDIEASKDGATFNSDGFGISDMVNTHSLPRNYVNFIQRVFRDVEKAMRYCKHLCIEKQNEKS